MEHLKWLDSAFPDGAAKETVAALAWHEELKDWEEEADLERVYNIVEVALKGFK